jgi:hypothetical protein
MSVRVHQLWLAHPKARFDLAVLSACLLGACDTTVVLGTDCPPLRGACVADEGGGPKDDAASGEHDADEPSPSDRDASESPHDAAVDADAEPDAGDTEPPDATAEVDAGPALFPPFQNPSFELRDGSAPGNLPALEMPSPIAPWYACRTGLSALTSVRAGTLTVEPTDGDTFLGDSFPIVALNLNGLNQNFDPPLRAGQRYAFMVDLWSESGLSGSLALEVASASSCIPPVQTLKATELLANGGWQPVCLRFTPPRDVSSLVLMVTAPEEYLNIGARLYLDNIRSDPDCQ